MGQYYKPVLISKTRKIRFLYSHHYDNGLKLTEHSWIGNNFVNAVQSQILGNPQRVGWVGDYAMDLMDDEQVWGVKPYQRKIPEKKLRKIWRICWEKEGKHEITPPPMDGFDLEHSKWFLVNHTQKLFVDIEAFVKKNKTYYKWYDGEVAMCLNPLPLLTACGNGCNGGDYYKCYPDYDKVGTWAFDLIELTEKKPDGYEAAEYEFREEEK